ncbi:ATP-dependent DNA helicase RecG [Actinoplanes sp. SE50]|uniref:ATP-dependent DNA helicase RecG n=1 Tax=unclassified Actinoplanes TaxID=2626549 RepID=UPI00023EDE91|nr:MULTISPECIES: ATP-dependent DNA helicase RecG [unclassified Actinoplanes]AEV88207.1 ATP-dependent DNA helicase RecG [Actinoplanes sp. SE50/110]ATO86612.1 ATP-dependent DNA helicase RecG [Actinoplanes sp. SE50]SLM04029.1 ATP-dependent DNA helicase RecG [Actinoplanes sp. SE50/110]
MTTTDTPLTKVLGAKTAKALAEHLELHTAGDLIYHFPRRYDERGEHTDLRQLEVGEQVTVLAQVQGIGVKPMRQRKGNMLEVTIGDGSGATLTCTFFNQAWRERELTRGRWGLFAGKVTEFRGKRQLNGPAYQLLKVDATQDEAAEEIEEFAGALIPVYPAAQAVPTWVLAKCVRTLLDTFEPPPDPMPAEVRAARNLVGIGTALREIHRPSSDAALYSAKHRLKWDEAFAVQLTLAQRRARAAAAPGTARPRRPGGLLDRFDADLPYELTDGQRSVGEEIAADLARAHPMHRLLQGEVGSGKTLVSVRAMLQVVDAGGQAALLAPTEVLATQHFRGIGAQLGALGRAGELDGDPEGTQLTLVTGSLGAAARRAALAKVADGSAGIVVGTHALLYEGVDFRDLGLIVVDEQHRFGVEQRDALRAKAARPPHVLVMTATPIPRTVAMTVYGDLETSVLSQLPRGRSPIASHVVPALEKPAYLDRAWKRVREEVAAGHQAYVVCPRIGEGPEDESPPSDDEPARRPPLAVTEVLPALRDMYLQGLRIEMLHGKMPPEEKDAVMRRFAAGDVDVLVATTVIEVGVDVPNSTVMIIMDADRFGVSQLHQLRGRVGRGSAPGVCLLHTEAVEGSAARERLDAVAATTDGFKLSEIDLEQRREGDVLGASQSGKHSHLRLLSLLRDEKLIKEARVEAAGLVGDDPDLTRYPALAASVAALVDEDRAEYLEKG